MRQLVKHFYEFGDFQIDVKNQLLLRAREVVALNPRTFDLLLALILKQGDIATKEELLKTVWKDAFVEEANLSHHVHLLRRALEEDTNGQRYIETIPKRGYRFVAPIREVGNGAGSNDAEPSEARLVEELKTGSSENQSQKQDSWALPVAEKQSLEEIPLAIPRDPHPLLPSVAARGVGLDHESSSSQVSEPGNLNLEIVPTRAPPKAGHVPNKWAVSRRTGAVCFVIIALLLGIVFFLRRSRQEEKADNRTQPRSVPFTTLPGMENQPAFSPDGKQVAFCWNGEKEDNIDVYVKLIGTESMLRLTTHPAQDTSPAWSPDGRFIAFRRNTGDESGFYLVPVLGGAERKVAAALPGRAHMRGRSVDWTPDGKFLVVVDRESEETPFNISVVSIETGEKRRLVSPAAPSTGVMGLAVSPDGRTVAFSQINPKKVDLARTQNDLYAVSFVGGQPKRLTFDSSWVSGMSWLPEGLEIVFVSQRKQPSGLIAPHSLWKISASGGEPIPLSIPSQFGQFPSSPTISREGNRLICEQREIVMLDIWRAAGPHASGKGVFPEKFIASTWTDRGPQFSPDGKRIAYSGGSTGSLEIWACDEQGQACAQLTSMAPRPAQNPRWSPDGSEVAFDSGHGIYVVRSDGGSPRALTVESSNEVLPSWSRDGQWVYYGSDQGGAWQIWKSPAAGGQAVQVTQRGGFEAFESFDGRFLYYTKPIGLIWTFGLSSIWRMPVAGGEETRVVERTSAGYWGLLNDGLCYLDPSGLHLPFSIQYLNFATGQIKKVGSIVQEPDWNSSNFAVSPDGRWILYTKRPREERDLMLVENFQ